MAGSWLDTRGHPQPVTTTWERWQRRNARRWREEYEKAQNNYTPSELRANSNALLRKRAKEIGHGNRFRARVNAKGGLNGEKLPGPAAMPHVIRHLSRSEINRVRANVKASTGRSSG